MFSGHSRGAWCLVQARLRWTLEAYQRRHAPAALSFWFGWMELVDCPLLDSRGSASSGLDGWSGVMVSAPCGAARRTGVRRSVALFFWGLRADGLSERPVGAAWAFLITFSCYGTKLHGRSAGSVDRFHNAWRGRYLEEKPSFHKQARSLLRHPPVRLNEDERRVVLGAIEQVCGHEGWFLHAAHVRSTHVHVVVSARVTPETVMGKLKAYASRALNREFARKDARWTRHGSTVWIWEPREVDSAVDYVVGRQGRPMAVYQRLNRWEEFLGWPEGVD